MSKYVCEHCGEGPEKEGVALYRTGDPGGAPHWRCSKDLPNAYRERLAGNVETVAVVQAAAALDGNNTHH